jgi:hypothetical protein
LEEIEDMRYAGELYFEDDDIINVPSLIVRSDSELSFLFVANWDGQGKWSKSGIASFDGQNYVSDTEPAVQVETGVKGPACKIAFSKVKKDGDYLSIDGFWLEEGESYPFEGDLEIQS